MPGGVDYSRFDRLVAEDEEDDRRCERQRREAEEERAQRERGAQRQKELEALRRAEEAWHQSRGEGKKEASPSHTGAAAKEGTGGGARSKAAGLDFGSMSQEDIENVDVDDFFRSMSAEEKEERQTQKREKQERRRLREEQSGRRPLREKGLTEEELEARVRKLEEDRAEMVALMGRSDRPAVRARLSEFVLELDNELARLRQDPLELDDEDRRALRLFHLRKLELPGTARARRERLVDDATCAPRPVTPAAAAAPHEAPREPPWTEIDTFAVDLGSAGAGAAAPSAAVEVDVRIEAVERLPAGAVACDFTRDSFDLRITHDILGKRYRLIRSCLQHDIDPSSSTFRIKRNHVVLRLAKARRRLEPQEEDEVIEVEEDTHEARRGAAAGRIGSPPPVTGQGRGGETLAAAVAPWPTWTELCAADAASRNPPPAAAEGGAALLPTSGAAPAEEDEEERRRRRCLDEERPV